MSSARTVFDIIKMVTPTAHSAHPFESTSETLTRLKFIGTLEAGEKLDVRNLKVESNTIITPIKRLFFGEGREATFAFIYSTIERSFAILYSLAAADKVSDSMLASNILVDMNKAVMGLVNLQSTYKDDKMFICNVETLMQTIEAKMCEVQQKYPDIYTTYVKFMNSKQSPSPSPSPSLIPSSTSFTALTPSNSFALASTPPTTEPVTSSTGASTGGSNSGGKKNK